MVVHKSELISVWLLIQSTFKRLFQCDVFVWKMVQSEVQQCCFPARQAGSSVLHGPLAAAATLISLGC